MTNFQAFMSLPVEEFARIMMCPNETGLVEIECDQSDNQNCYQCCLDWLRSEQQRCRVCGCTWNNACESGCYWIEPDLCSMCADSDKL